MEVEIDSSKGKFTIYNFTNVRRESRHGYQIIKDLEERFKGFYSPSPGSVYPILQMLEDRDFVSISKEGNKKSTQLQMKVKLFKRECRPR